jgi:hypothetical protein
LDKTGSGVILPADHSFWKEYGYPPYHYQCRTGVGAVYKSQLEDSPPVNAPTEDFAAFTPQDGFGGNPVAKESWWKLTPGMIERATKYGVDGEIIRFAIKNGIDKKTIKQLVAGYPVVYTGKDGGFVKQSPLARPGAQNRQEKGEYVETDELGAAERAADKGYQIHFLPNIKIKDVTSPDITIDYHLADIKHIFKPTENAVYNAIRSASEQGAPYALIEIVTDAMTIETIKKAIERGFSNPEILVEKVVVSFKNDVMAFNKKLP